jgi:hypothetical protein
MNKANSIEKLIRAGATVADVVKKLKVSKSYVYVVIHARMGKTENLKMKKEKKVVGFEIAEVKAEGSKIAYDTGFLDTTNMVSHPPHYTVGGIEVIDFIEAKGLGYNLGNVIKYVSRAGKKDDYLEDLQKARWYLNREIGRVE